MAREPATVTCIQKRDPKVGAGTVSIYRVKREASSIPKLGDPSLGKPGQANYK